MFYFIVAEKPRIHWYIKEESGNFKYFSNIATLPIKKKHSYTKVYTK